VSHTVKISPTEGVVSSGAPVDNTGSEKTKRSKNERLKIAGSQSTTLFFVSISSSGGLRRQRCCRR
jgi:hypothetical protein